MTFLIAMVLVGVCIYQGTLASLVWVAAACAVATWGFIIRGQWKPALYAAIICVCVFAAGGMTLDGLSVDPALTAVVTSLIVLAVVAYGVLRVFGLKGKKSGGDPR